MGQGGGRKKRGSRAMGGAGRKAEGPEVEGSCRAGEEGKQGLGEEVP